MRPAKWGRAECYVVPRAARARQRGTARGSSTGGRPRESTPGDCLSQCCRLAEELVVDRLSVASLCRCGGGNGLELTAVQPVVVGWWSRCHRAGFGLLHDQSRLWPDALDRERNGVPHLPQQTACPMGRHRRDRDTSTLHTWRVLVGPAGGQGPRAPAHDSGGLCPTVAGPGIPAEACHHPRALVPRIRCHAKPVP